MDARKFVKLVGDMMTAQADYWKNRTQSNLIYSKDLEKQVRRALLDGITFGDELPVVQGDLFMESGDEAHHD